ncbi:serine protease HtrA [Rhodopirellula sallentina SM41]|uniref:Serine protease HtrA n=2 Tax=Rhodopirellula TaxID=265488 RepID=M5TZ51_9BACT|nr:serine protease HtrA [Rhodopirellula sallentina SM41]
MSGVARSIAAGLCVTTIAMPGIVSLRGDAACCHAEEAQATESEDVSIEQIERWVKQLSSDSYLRRKRATADLTRAGQVAVRPLVSELETGDLETTERVISILQEIASTASIIPPKTQPQNEPASEPSEAADEATAEPTAWDELLRISTLGGSRGTRAKIATKEVRDVRRALAVDLLSDAGVFVGTTEFIIGARSELKRIVEFDGVYEGDPALLDLLQWVDGIEYARLKGDAIRLDILEGVVRMPDLKTLALLHGDVDADELRTLGAITELRRLELRYVPMSGELIDQLATLPIRVSLTLNGTAAPAERVDALRKTVPGLEIIFKQGGFLGVQCYDNFNECLINEVLRGQAAEKAGLLPGDVVLQVDGKPIKQFKDLQKAIDAHMPGEEIDIVYQRGQQEKRTTARLGKLEEQ